MAVLGGTAIATLSCVQKACFSYFIFLILIFIPTLLHADPDRRDNVVDANRRTNNGAQQQTDLANMERAIAAQLEKQAKEQDAECAS